jgi:TonB family protein
VKRNFLALLKYGMASAGKFRKGQSKISTGGMRAIVMGSLERSVIDSYIRRNLEKIRWCYERELAKSPNIFGRIKVKFTITESGSVRNSNVLRTAMGNSTVEKCVARTIKKIRFPKPLGGGIVVVNYPFVFKNSEV